MDLAKRKKWTKVANAAKNRPKVKRQKNKLFCINIRNGHNNDQEKIERF